MEKHPTTTCYRHSQSVDTSDTKTSNTNIQQQTHSHAEDVSTKPHSQNEAGFTSTCFDKHFTFMVCRHVLNSFLDTKIKMLSFTHSHDFQPIRLSIIFIFIHLMNIFKLQEVYKVIKVIHMHQAVLYKYSERHNYMMNIFNLNVIHKQTLINAHT